MSPVRNMKEFAPKLATELINNVCSYINNERMLMTGLGLNVIQKEI